MLRVISDYTKALETLEKNILIKSKLILKLLISN